MGREKKREREKKKIIRKMKTEILQNKKITETQKKKKIAIVKISSRSFTKQTRHIELRGDLERRGNNI